MRRKTLAILLTMLSTASTVGVWKWRTDQREQQRVQRNAVKELREYYSEVAWVDSKLTGYVDGTSNFYHIYPEREKDEAKREEARERLRQWEAATSEEKQYEYWEWRCTCVEGYYYIEKYKELAPKMQKRQLKEFPKDPRKDPKIDCLPAPGKTPPTAHG